ncbi:hypothetical protein OAO87_04560 [bacterium]|nr:hypothetical protein [bacterium]
MVSRHRAVASMSASRGGCVFYEGFHRSGAFTSSPRPGATDARDATTCSMCATAHCFIPAPAGAPADSIFLFSLPRRAPRGQLDYATRREALGRV